MRCIGYVRVSTEMQVDAGYSLEAQRQDIERYCELYKIELVEIISDEGVSAKNIRRPGLEKALKILQEIDGLIVAKLDRLTRSVKDLGHLLDKYFKYSNLISVSEKIDTSSANGRFVLNILVSVAQYEREATSERVKRSMDVKKDKGERVGGIPYGKRLSADGIHLEEDMDEQHIIGHAKTLKVEGQSFRAIKSLMTVNGMVNRNNRPFSLSAVHSLVRG